MPDLAPGLMITSAGQTWRVVKVYPSEVKFEVTASGKVRTERLLRSQVEAVLRLATDAGNAAADGGQPA